MTKDQGQPKIHEELGEPIEAKELKEAREPFHATEVKRRIKCCLELPEIIVFPDHTLERMADHDMQTTDVHNAMRGGAVWDQYRECKAGRWRYCMGTRKFRIVFILEDDAVVLITAISLERQ